ncbi:MAG: class I SAM-dependent methyltransferase [Alphaproteobacteria bacterium]|nr:MAG: class I SAM-dependent methyltransferase [Alphaproteobacteria bacterium]
MTNHVTAHPIEWTPERVKRFWDFYSSNPALDDTYFARLVGRSLLAFVGKRIRIGSAADIGCGRGDLIEFLLDGGHSAYGADSSASSLEKVRKRFEGRSGFKGTTMMDGGKVSLPSETIDTAFMIEVVEHMDDGALQAALTEAKRLLRKGGHVVLTTPNEENLDASKTMCPECGSIYHRVQHVRSWSADTLRAYVEPLGFSTLTCEATVLAPYTGPLGLLYRTVYPMIRHRRPHLVYIGRKIG